MEILYVRNTQEDSDNSKEAALLKAKRNNDSEINAASLRKKLISAVNYENKDIVKSVFDEIFNTSDVFVKSSSSDSHSQNQEKEFELWRDAMYIAMDKSTKHSEEIVKLLLDGDIIWRLETKMNGILLHRLIDRRPENKVDDKKLRLVEMLLKSGKINVNARNNFGYTALHWADEEKLTSLLIHYGADVNRKDNKGVTPFWHMFGVRVSVLQTIVKEARALVDLETVDWSGHTALMTATIHNLPNIVEFLLDAGASVNLSDHLGFTALHHALYTRFDQYDHFPRNSEELKKRKEIYTILFEANDEQCQIKYYEQKMKIVEMLLRVPDIDVNALSFENFSPLDIAELRIPEISSSIKNALKEKGATLSVFQKTEFKSASGFHMDVRCRLALERTLCRILKDDEEGLPVNLSEKRLLSLIDRFKDQIVSGKDEQGRTALHLFAIFFSIIWAQHWVVSKNDAKNYLRKLEYREVRISTIVQELVAVGCSINETDIYGRTPLHYADNILKDSLISHGANASIKDKDGISAIYEIPQQSSTKSSETVKAVIELNDEAYILRLINDKQMEIEVQSVDTPIRACDDREFWLKTVPRLLWENDEYAFRHPFLSQIVEDVIDLMRVIAKEIERLDPRFEIRHELVGSSNEGTRLNKPDEFDFCFVLTKISKFCEVFQSPELPTGFVHIKRKPIKVDGTSDFDSFFGNDGILNTEKLNWQFTAILRNALVNIESRQSLDCNLKLLRYGMLEHMKIVSNIVIIKPQNSTRVYYISIDIVPCIHVDGWWPDEAIFNVSEEMKTLGCNLVFDRPQDLYPWVPYSEFCARISFSKAESDVISQSDTDARHGYLIGKTMIEYSSYHCGYILKNCLLYCLEALTPTSEKASQLGLSLEEMKLKFHQMDRYLWLKCLMKCHLEFVSQDFCPCYFLPKFSSPIEIGYLKEYTNRSNKTAKDRKKTYSLYRCTLTDASESCCQLPAPDQLWERFDRDKLITSLCEIAYKEFKTIINNV